MRQSSGQAANVESFKSLETHQINAFFLRLVQVHAKWQMPVVRNLALNFYFYNYFNFHFHFRMGPLNGTRGMSAPCGPQIDTRRNQVTRREALQFQLEFECELELEWAAIGLGST